MPPQDNLGNINTVPQQQTPLEPPRSFRLMHSPLALAAALAVVVVIGAALYWWYEPLSGPAPPSKTYVVGILQFPQQTDAVIAFQKKMEELGYREGVNVRYDMVRVSPNPTMIEEFTTGGEKLIRGGGNMIYATLKQEGGAAIRETKKYQSDI